MSRLRHLYPDVGVYEENGRIVGAFGRPMTRGATADDAINGFLAEHGELFAEDLDLRPTVAAAFQDGRKVVHGFSQVVDGIPVAGSVLRILAHDMGTPGPQRWAVAYAAGNIANPTLPLPERLLSSVQALAIAQEHPQGAGLTRWVAPEEMLMWERMAGPTAVTRVWKVQGSASIVGTEARSFYINARTGAVLEVVNNFARASMRLSAATPSRAVVRKFPAVVGRASAILAASIPGAVYSDTTITGTVEGWATPGLKPDTYSFSCTGGNDPVLMPLKYVLIQVIHNNAVFDSDYFDADGEYSVSAPNQLNGKVVAWLASSRWAVTDWVDDEYTTPASSELDAACVVWQPHLLEDLSPGSVVDFEFNAVSSPDCVTREFCTASVNAFRLAGVGSDYIHDRIQVATVFPCLEIYTNYPPANCNPQYAGTSSYGLIIAGVVDDDCANGAYGTVLMHEYGHYVTGTVLDFSFTLSSNRPFHEGTGDVFGMLSLGSRLIGEDLEGCETVVRDISTSDEEYPHCGGDYPMGLVLARAWWDIWCNLGEEGCGEDASLATTQNLHVAWLYLTAGPGDPPATCSTRYQAAHPFTLIEVLTADDNDANLSNGTPHHDEICAAFAGRNIGPPSGFSVCGEAVAEPCLSDCDNNAVLDVFDFACFVDRLKAGEPWACNLDESTGNGVGDVFDWLAFQNLFDQGCP